MHIALSPSHFLGLGCLIAAFPVCAQNVAPSPAAPPLSTLPSSQPPLGVMPSAGELQLSRQLNPPQPAALRISVSQVAIVGVQALPFESIAQFFQPLVGQEVTVAQLSNAAAQATAFYQQAGYPLSFAYLPEQTFEQGVVRVTVIEGQTNTLEISGDAGKSEALLRAITAPILSAAPLDTTTFERQTLLLSRMEHLQAVASASLPTTTDGNTPLKLQLERKLIMFNVGADLRQGNSKAIGTLTLNDPLWGGSQLQVSSLLDKPHRERYASATFNQWLNAQGTTLRASYSDFKGQDNFSSSAMQSMTLQRKLDITVMHPWVLNAQISTLLGAGFFGLDYEKAYVYPSVNLVLDDIEKVRGLQLHAIWQQSAAASMQRLNATLTRGLDTFGAGPVRRANLDLALRPNAAKFDFTRLSFDYAWRARGKQLVGAALGIGGQWSPHALPVSERVSFGSSRYARGYRSGEAAGDQGLGASVELNRMFTRPSGQWLKTVEPYAKYEWARTWFHTAGLTGQTLKSTSLGLRLSDNRYYALDVSGSKPQGDSSPYNPSKKLRYSLSLSYQLDL